MIAVIGSHAFNPTKRIPKDLDIICTFDDFNKFVKANYSDITEKRPINHGKKWIVKGHSHLMWHETDILEAEIAWGDGNSADKILELINNDSDTVYNRNLAYASLDVCYMLKMSHRFLKNSPHFLKTMNDIIAMREASAKIRPEWNEVFKQREKETYNYSHPSLMKSKEGFFNGDGVKYKFSHDSIHESIKLGDRPAYEYFKSDNAEVMCDMRKFAQLDEQIKLNAVYEEAVVLSLERSVIPFDTLPNVAFRMALEKVCTSITSGAFRSFAYDNFHKVFNMYTVDTFNKFDYDVAYGKVKLHGT